MKTETQAGEPVTAENDYVTIEEASKITGASVERISELFNQGLFSMTYGPGQGQWSIWRDYLERIEAYATKAYAQPEPEAIGNLADSQQLRSQIRHAFADADINAAMEDTEEDAYRTYRRMLELHFEAYLDLYCDTEEDENLFWSIVDSEAESIGQAEIYRKAMEVS